MSTGTTIVPTDGGLLRVPLNLEMDCLAEYLARITSCALGKYYMKDVGGKGNPELTTTRNLILEIMIKAPKN